MLETLAGITSFIMGVVMIMCALINSHDNRLQWTAIAALAFGIGSLYMDK